MTARTICLVTLCLSIAAAAGAAEEAPAPVRAERIIDAPVVDVWRAWTTDAGIQSFWAPASNIELEPQGAYEVFFLPDAEPGKRGSEGTHILGYQKHRMLSFTWALPPYMPEVRAHHTHVTLRFAERDNGERTRLSIAHDGWGTGKHWNEAHAYFQKVWPKVLEELAKTLEADE